MTDEHIDDVLSSDAFAGPREPATEPIDLAPDVVVGEVTFRGTNAFAHHTACEGTHRVPAGAGFWSGDPHADLCTWCYEVALDDPFRAPTPEEEIRLARHGLGRSGDACFVEAGEDPGATIARLAELVADGQLPRIALEQGPRLGDWLESGGVLPDGAVVRRDGISMQFNSMPLRSLEQHLRGESGGPPIDPDLMARIEAAQASGDRDALIALGDEYHLALIAQSEAASALRGDPEPIIEDGRGFPTTPEDEPPLG